MQHVYQSSCIKLRTELLIGYSILNLTYLGGITTVGVSGISDENMMVEKQSFTHLWRKIHSSDMFVPLFTLTQ